MTNKPEITKRGVIYPTMACNLRCAFCYYRFQEDKKTRPLSEVFAELNLMREYYKHDSVDITGGEPTVYPHIVDMVEYCNEIGLKSTIITNGQRSEVLSKCIDSGLNDVLISVHDLYEDYDNLTMVKGSFERLENTLKMLKARSFGFRANVTITAFNLKRLEEISIYLAQYNPRIVNFIVFNPHSGTDWNEKIDEASFQISYSEIWKSGELKKAIDYLMKKGIWCNIRYMPLCSVDENYRKHICNFHQWQYDPKEWSYLSGWKVPMNTISDMAKNLKSRGTFGSEDIEIISNGCANEECSGNIFKESCLNCKMKKICDGIYPEYKKKFGTEEFIPEEGEQIEDPMFYRGKFKEEYSK